jgi:hypothetical protein
MDVAFEVVQSLVAVAALALAAVALRRREPPAPPALPVEVVPEVVPAVKPEVAAAVRRGPIALPRNPAPKAPPVCECGVPGRACRDHGRV